MDGTRGGAPDAPELLVVRSHRVRLEERVLLLELLLVDARDVFLLPLRRAPRVVLPRGRRGHERDVAVERVALQTRERVVLRRVVQSGGALTARHETPQLAERASCGEGGEGGEGGRGGRCQTRSPKGRGGRAEESGRWHRARRVGTHLRGPGAPPHRAPRRRAPSRREGGPLVPERGGRARASEKRFTPGQLAEGVDRRLALFEPVRPVRPRSSELYYSRSFGRRQKNQTALSLSNLSRRQRPEGTPSQTVRSSKSVRRALGRTTRRRPRRAATPSPSSQGPKV